MTTTDKTQAAATGQSRRMARGVAGVLVVVVCAGLFAVLAIKASGGRAVWVATDDISAGAVIDAKDVSSVVMSGDGVGSLIGEGESIAGKVAAVRVLAGTPLTTAIVSSQAATAPGRAETSLNLKPGHYPSGIAEGAHAAIFLRGAESEASTDSADTSSASSEAARVDATVTGVETLDDGSAVVSVDIAEAEAEAVAVSDAAEITLMRISGKGR